MLRPLVWFSGCRHQPTAGGWEIVFECEALDVVAEGGEAVQEPQRDADFTCRTRYLIAPGCVTREDTFTCPPGGALCIELLAAVYDAQLPVVLQGYTHTERRRTTLCSPTGPLAQEIIARAELCGRTLLTVSWQVRYRE